MPVFLLFQPREKNRMTRRRSRSRSRISGVDIILIQISCVATCREEHRHVADAPLGSRQEQLCYIKIFIQDLRVCGRIENIDKIFVLCSFSVSSRALFLYSRRSLVSLVAHRRSERMAPTIHPSERIVVSRSSRDQRDTRPRVTRVTLTRGDFYYFVPLFVVNPLSRIIDVFNFIKIFLS
jgi:hypothetical protein